VTGSLGLIPDETVSQGVAKKMVYAGVHARSFEESSGFCSELAELDIQGRRIGRLVKKIGTERVEQRDLETESWQAFTSKQRAIRAVAEPPKCVAVSMDGGRLQIRERVAAEAAAETSEGSPVSEARGAECGEKGKFWREMKGGLLMELEAVSFDEDPYFEIPDVFVDPKRMSRLASEVHGGASGGSAPEREPPDEDLSEEPYDSPKILRRHVIASRREVKLFGPHLASEAWRLGFMHAEKGGFVCDGSETNWGVWRRYFPDFTPITDFVHAVCYLYQAVMQNLPVDEGWDLYCRMAQMLWSGEPAEVLDGLLGLQQEVGLPSPDESDSSPRNHLAAAIRYLANQQSRMRYAEYRQAGLPVTSCHMESTIKQINRRVKGTEKFWSEDGGEAILQLAADYLSDHSPLDSFWPRRENQADGVRRYR
jgi:hypothetical protein